MKNMQTVEDILDSRKGESALIIGAGATIKTYKEQIDLFINKTAPFTIGINNMTDFWVPMFHVWTNNQRFRTYGKNINSKSNLLLGSNISLKVVKEIIGDRNYVLLNRVDRSGVPISYKNGTIYGYFRTAGCLSIMLAHLMGAKAIHVVGMDGYTFHDQKDVMAGKESQHCYGSGHTDTANWKACIDKDNIINNVLMSIKDYGINFNIITPTKYNDFYKGIL